MLNKLIQHRFYPWIVCSIAAIFYCYEYFLRIFPSVITSDLIWYFQIHAAALGNLIGFYYFAYTPMQLPVGLLMDRFEPKKVLTLACLVSVIGAYFFACCNLYWVSAFGRFAVGLGAAFAFVGVLKLATVWMPPERFALVSGITTMLGMVGAMVGVTVFAGLVEKYPWQKINMVLIICGIVLTAIIYFFVSEKKVKHSHVKTHLSFRHLLIDFIKILKNSQIWINGFVGCLLFTSLSVFAETWGVTYVEHVYGLDKVDAAFLSTMVFLGWAVGSPLFGWLSDHIQKRVLPLRYGSLLGFICITILLYYPYLPIYLVGTLLFFYGFCCSVEVIVFAIGRENSPSLLAGTAVAVTNMLVMTGGIILQPRVGDILNWQWSGLMIDGIPHYTDVNFKIAMSILPISMFLCWLLTYVLKETHAVVKDHN